ncbi:MAG: ABC transporter substrate-binding protein [Alphaproteobacteria bacterium]|nr:ABC transporter substrate-binding protein [Alphaproteobacteria bacterium]
MRRLLGAVLALALSAQAAQAGDAVAAKTYVDKIASQALAIVKTTDAQPVKQAKLETLFKTIVDIPFIGRFVLGRHWNVATPVQQQAYLKAYEPFLMKGYVGRIAKYSGQSYKLGNAKQETDGSVVVTMEIVDPGKPSVFVDYRLRDEKTSFKVTDIVVEGVSLLNVQRSEFNSVVNSKGIDYLISALNKKVLAAK